MILVGVAAAIIGDNLGYWAGRKGGRPLLERYRLTRRFANRYLPRGERFFAAHGGKAVFLGRLRRRAPGHRRLDRRHVAHALVAFFGWNAAGGIVWATG